MASSVKRDPESIKAQHKRVLLTEAPTIVAVRGKRYGYQCREASCGLMDTVARRPVIAVPALASCTNANCENVEEFGGARFKRCAYCLTIYCSQACMADDWKNGEHKAYCKTEAYRSQLDRFSMENVPSDLGFMLSDDYIKAWDEWIKSDLMQKVLKHCGKKVEEMRPKSMLRSQ